MMTVSKRPNFRKKVCRFCEDNGIELYSEKCRYGGYEVYLYAPQGFNFSEPECHSHSIHADDASSAWFEAWIYLSNYGLSSCSPGCGCGFGDPTICPFGGAVFHPSTGELIA